LQCFPAHCLYGGTNRLQVAVLFLVGHLGDFRGKPKET
jgi:hypothetical protein